MHCNFRVRPPDVAPVILTSEHYEASIASDALQNYRKLNFIWIRQSQISSHLRMFWRLAFFAISLRMLRKFYFRASG